MAGPPPPCNPPATAPKGTGNIDITWYRVWPITYIINVSAAYYPTALKEVATAGGKILSVTWHSGVDNSILPGFDQCGNPISPGAGAGGGGSPPTCPPGYIWDPTSENCVPIGTIIPPPGGGIGGGGGGGGGGGAKPPPAPPPPPPHPEPAGDELEDCCAQSALYLWYIAIFLQELVAAQPIGLADDCCAKITAQLTAISGSAAQIVELLGKPPPEPGKPPDLSKIEVALQTIAQNTTPPNAQLAALIDCVCKGLPAIANAVAGQKPTDVSQIVEQLKKLYSTIDVPMPVYRNLADRGLISPELLQAIGSGEFGAGAVSVVVDFVQTALKWVASWAGITWTGKRWTMQPLGRTIANDVSAAVGAALKSGAAPLYPEVSGMIAAVVKVLLPTAPPELGDVHVDDDLILAKTLAPILIINGVALVADYFGWEISEQLREYVDLAAEFVGLNEVRELKVGQLMRYGPMRVAEMNAKRVYRQELPGAGVLADLAARGILPTPRYGQLAPLTGIPTELQGATLEAAHGGLNARLLLRFVESGLFTDRDLADEMTFNGIRPASQHRMLLAAPWLATKTERDQLRASVEKAYAGGLFTDVDFTSRIDALEQETDRGRLILARVKLERALGVLKEIENAYETEFLAGITDAPTYQSKLQGLGLQLDYVAGIMAKAEAHANARLVRQAAAAERALQKATTAAERRSALADFQTGKLNAAGLAAALVATGLTPIQVAAWVEQAVAQGAGKLRLEYGLRLSPAEATLLRQRVADLTKQRELQMLSDTQFVLQLQALKIPPTFINALRAYANAHISPKTAAVLTPVATE